MDKNSTVADISNYEDKNGLNKNLHRSSSHTFSQERKYYIILLGVIVLLSCIYPLLGNSAYSGSSDLHATIEVIGSLFGLIVGLTLVTRFYVLGNRFLLLIGLAYFVNGAEDLIHGLLSFSYLHKWIGLPSSSLSQFIPGTYVTGRLLMGLLLLFTPLLSKLELRSLNPKQETRLFSLTALIVTMVFTAIAFQLPLPKFMMPEWFISRPVDFVSAIILLGALITFLFEYHKKRDILICGFLFLLA